MDYLYLLRKLKEEFLKKNKERYEGLSFLPRLIFTILFIGLRISFFFGRLGYWFTWFFFKALAAPVDYLQKWLKSEREELHPAAQAILYFVCLPTIFGQQVLLAFNSFFFFFQWFGLMLQAYIMTLGAVKWQPIITEAVFDDEPEVEPEAEPEPEPEPEPAPAPAPVSQYSCPNCGNGINYGDATCKVCGQQFDWGQA